MFNTAVPAHPLAPVLLRMINWAQPDDPEKKYPELGRMRYAWMTEDFKQIKLLLKDGPGSWTDNEWQDGMMKQIKGHEGFVDVKVCERDNCYLEATFNPISDEDCHYDRWGNSSINSETLSENIMIGDATATRHGATSVTKSPWVVFDEAMAALSEGKMSPRMENLANSLKDMFASIDAEEKIDDELKKNNITTEPGSNVKVFSVDPNGNLENQDPEKINLFKNKDDE